MKARERLAELWRWLRREVLNRRMFLWFVIAEAVFWSPCIAGVVLAAVVSPWWWTVCTVYMAFWALPLTPAIPLQIGLAFGLKKLADACRARDAGYTARKALLRAMKRGRAYSLCGYEIITELLSAWFFKFERVKRSKILLKAVVCCCNVQNFDGRTQNAENFANSRRQAAERVGLCREMTAAFKQCRSLANERRMREFCQRAAVGVGPCREMTSACERAKSTGSDKFFVGAEHAVKCRNMAQGVATSSKVSKRGKSVETCCKVS